jgi:hypothetical protein
MHAHGSHLFHNLLDGSVRSENAENWKAEYAIGKLAEYRFANGGAMNVD